MALRSVCQPNISICVNENNNTIIRHNDVDFAYLNAQIDLSSIQLSVQPMVQNDRSKQTKLQELSYA